MPIFMKAGTIRGDVTDGSYVGWVWVDDLKLGVDVTIKSVDPEESGSKEKTKLEAAKIEIRADSSSPQLMQWMLDGTELPSVEFDVCTSEHRCHLKFTLKQVTLTDYKLGVDGDDRQSLSLQLDYHKLEMQHTSFGSANTKETKHSASVGEG